MPRPAWPILVNSRVVQRCPDLGERAIGKAEWRTAEWCKQKAIRMLLSARSRLFYRCSHRPNSELLVAFSARMRKKQRAQQGRRRGIGELIRLKRKNPSLATSVQQLS